jgi:hypothetical protein
VIEQVPYATRRTLEIWTAVAIAVVGIVVSSESLTHDIAWNEAGPGSGYFPFRVGLLLIGIALVQAIRVLPPATVAKATAARKGGSHLETRRTGSASIERRGTGSASIESHASIESRGTGSASIESHASGPVIFVTREEFRRTLSVFWPTAALVIAMFALGSYLPSAVYLTWMMRTHGGRGWLVSAGYGAAVMAAFFLIFDVWFRVPLARGFW